MSRRQRRCRARPSSGQQRRPTSQQGDGALEDRTVLLAQPSAGRHGEHHPACLHLKQVDAHQPVERGWQLAAEGGLEDFKPRHSLERREGMMEDSNPAPILLRRPRSER